ncbi:bifunctional folylpolyglutamate synthase/dihydrofolate synthase [Desulfospira joergensenii]|uniref:bifunctional folylpolyglutamate synthase/dihydrofolate synthase n=1 Tax=Desulfospira joergensenii TaxID=53329 RepID=UPI001FC9DF3E|nr:folylpolyglutamate synthase/dihydrofolate synthase family protein [Desulfospira joergensenii]
MPEMKKSPYQECLDRIYRLGRFGIKLELETIQNILRFLNNPHKNYNIVHVAGTNGKGSTATYISSILKEAGFKTGIYTSPHLVRFNERICVDGQEITDDGVVAAFEAVKAVDMGKRKATFFEIATAMAFYHFSREKVDWAVIETGMGGRFDATNIVVPRVSVITNLSIEHTDYLGSTIRDLAREKGGIIKPNTPVVTAVSQTSGMEVLQTLAQKQKAPFYLYKKDFSTRKYPGRSAVQYNGIFQKINDLAMPLPGEHQKENLGLALAACELIFDRQQKRDPRYDLTPDLVKQGLAKAKWPGRLEIACTDPLVILDGAHNLKAAQVLGRYLSTALADKKLTLVIGILNDKPYEAMLKHLLPWAEELILTRPKIDRSLDTRILKTSALKFFKGPILEIEDVKEAAAHALAKGSRDKAVCIAGSLYVVGEAKEKIDMDFIS